MVGDEDGKATFQVCPTCAATVYYANEGAEESMAIPVGAFAESNFPAPTFQVYEDRKHEWLGLPGNIQHMA